MEKRSNSLIAGQNSVHRMRYLMGTFVEIEVSGEGGMQSIEAIESSFSEMRRIERILSKYIEGSEIYKINRFAYLLPVEVSLEVFELLEESVRLSHLTNGAFDITIGAIMEFWERSQKRDITPADKEISDVSSNTGSANIILDSGSKTVFFKTPVKIDMGGIGKGYVIDMAMNVLRKKEIKKALINAGGNIFCMDSEYSNIAIKNPLEQDEIIATVFVKDKAVSTSANYERAFSIEGRRYGHLIDPGTGYPTDNDILSVSIISDSAKKADIFSTAVFILGRSDGMRLIERTDNLEGIIVTNNYRMPQLCVSSGLARIFQSSYILN